MCVCRIIISHIVLITCIIVALLAGNESSQAYPTSGGGVSKIIRFGASCFARALNLPGPQDANISIRTRSSRLVVFYQSHRAGPRQFGDAADIGRLCELTDFLLLSTIPPNRRYVSETQMEIVFRGRDNPANPIYEYKLSIISSSPSSTPTVIGTKTLVVDTISPTVEILKAPEIFAGVIPFNATIQEANEIGLVV